ncbi:MAG: hypothetical protein AAB737_00335, partial [Patescibacteria group bacterium]
STSAVPFLTFDTQNYRLGIGTTSPGGTLALNGNIVAGGTGTSTFSNGITLTSGCFLMSNGVCAGAAGGGGPINIGTVNRLAYYSAADTIDSANFLTTDITNSRLGIGTTSPFAKLSIHANATETNNTLFAVASSTASATTTLFSILNTGNVGIGTTSPAALFSVAGNIYLTGGLGVGRATTTSGVIETTGVINVQGTGTSSFTNGVNLAAGCFAIGGSCLTSGVTSVSNSDGTLTVSPTTGAVVASLNLANANTWTGGQTFNLSTSTQATSTVFHSNFGNFSTSTIGNLLAGTITATSTTASSTLTNFGFTQGQGTGLSLTNLTVSASTTLTRFGSTGDAFIGAASTDLLTVTASSTFVSNAGFLGNLQIGDAQADRLTVNAGVVNYTNSSTSTIPQLVNAWSIGTTTAVGNAPIFSIDGLNGRVGIGTTSPSQALSVLGHCVVGDTRLRIRRRRKKKIAPWEPDTNYEVEPHKISGSSEYDYLEI